MKNLIVRSWTIFVCRQMTVCSILLLLSAGNVAPAAEEFATFIFESDVFTDNSDDGYTNGMGYAWGRAGFDEFDDSNTPGWIQWLSEDLYISTMPDKRRAITYQGFQSITNPTDSDISELQPDDYPYAGTLTWKVTQYAIDDQVTDTVSLLLGAVGPVSLAEQAQKLVHELTDSVDPQGWDNQLNNEPLFELGAGRKWRLLDGLIRSIKALFCESYRNTALPLPTLISITHPSQHTSSFEDSTLSRIF